MVDHITHLPEEILLHILSFLPTTKHRAVTSLLSRRWRHLWTHVPSLEFHRNEYIDSPHYPALVNLCLHNSPTLHRLSAFLPPPHFSPRKKAHDLLHTWLSTAASRSVRELSLRFDTHRRGFRLPPSLLSCAPSLRVLKLHTCDLSLHIPWGTCVFPCLETVVLQNIGMKEQQFHDLLAMCPNLVDLQFYVRCSHIRISSSVNPRLKNLGIRSYFSRLVVDVSDLRYLSLASGSFKDLRVSEMPKLKEVEFLWMSRRREPLPLTFLEVEVLSATAEFFKVHKGEDLTFANLKVLHGKRIPSDISFDYFTSFLEHCPLLEKIYITLFHFFTHQEFKEFVEFNELNVTPTTRKCPVKSITIVGFTGRGRNMLLLKYFLGVMPRLNHLHLIIDEEEIPGISREDFLNQVRQFPRISPCVNIVVETSSSFSPPSIGRCFDFD